MNPKVFYATCDGLFYVSKDGGVTFESTGRWWQMPQSR